jgi:hypothetical protein
MAYLKWNALVITDAPAYTIKQAKELIREFKEKHPENAGLANRSDKSYLNEWAVHVLAYLWGYKKDKAKDADLEFEMEPELKLMYGILGPIARLILKFYKK